MKENKAFSRRRFLQLTGVAGAAIATIQPFRVFAADNDVAADDNRAYPATAMPDRIVLTWTDDPSTSQTVTWRTHMDVTTPVAQIAEADGSPDFHEGATSVTPASSTLSHADWQDRYHQATFDNLRPETVYHYRLGDGYTWTEWFQFKTAAQASKAFSFIYLGDAQNNILSAWSHVVRRAIAQSPDVRFILHAGDLINDDASDDEWGEWHAGDGWAQSGISCVATPGNHEYERRDISPQWNYQFAFPQNGPDAAALKNTVYYIDYQGVRFISLDTALMEYPSYAYEQRNWLKGVLRDNPNRWTVVTHHHPMRAGASGRTGHIMLNLLFRTLYERYNVDLVLQGHDHTYARGNLSLNPWVLGPVYVVSVSGPKMYDLDAGWADVSAENLQFYQYITIKDDVLQFRTYTSVGVCFDAFDLEKQGDGNNRLIERG